MRCCVVVPSWPVCLRPSSSRPKVLWWCTPRDAPSWWSSPLSQWLHRWRGPSACLLLTPTTRRLRILHLPVKVTKKWPLDFNVVYTVTALYLVDVIPELFLFMILVLGIFLYWRFNIFVFKIYNLFCPPGTKIEGEPKLSAGHPVPLPGQAAASKCPFLAAEMGQKNSSVVRDVSMEFQEDVQEVRTVQKGKSRWDIYKGYFTFTDRCLNLMFSCSPLRTHLELSRDRLANTIKKREDDRTNLMTALLKQRPKKVSHLLQDNLPSNSKF